VYFCFFGVYFIKTTTAQKHHRQNIKKGLLNQAGALVVALFFSFLAETKNK